ncbi:MAG: hypothetical protein R6U55_14840 [Desulfovermiculus sp.]
MSQGKSQLSPQLSIQSGLDQLRSMLLQGIKQGDDVFPPVVASQIIDLSQSLLSTFLQIFSRTAVLSQPLQKIPVIIPLTGSLASI